jgi:hypothetical protein
MLLTAELWRITLGYMNNAKDFEKLKKVPKHIRFPAILENAVNELLEKSTAKYPKSFSDFVRDAVEEKLERQA